MRRVRRSFRAISPVLAVVMLIAIVVVGALGDVALGRDRREGPGPAGDSGQLLFDDRRAVVGALSTVASPGAACRVAGRPPDGAEALPEGLGPASRTAGAVRSRRDRQPHAG